MQLAVKPLRSKNPWEDFFHRIFILNLRCMTQKEVVALCCTVFTAPRFHFPLHIAVARFDSSLQNRVGSHSCLLHTRVKIFDYPLRNAAERFDLHCAMQWESNLSAQNTTKNQDSLPQNSADRF